MCPCSSAGRYGQLHHHSMLSESCVILLRVLSAQVLYFIIWLLLWCRPLSRQSVSGTAVLTLLQRTSQILLKTLTRFQSQDLHSSPKNFSCDQQHKSNTNLVLKRLLILHSKSILKRGKRIFFSCFFPLYFSALYQIEDMVFKRWLASN